MRVSVLVLVRRFPWRDTAGWRKVGVADTVLQKQQQQQQCVISLLATVQSYKSSTFVVRLHQENLHRHPNTQSSSTLRVLTRSPRSTRTVAIRYSAEDVRLFAGITSDLNSTLRGSGGGGEEEGRRWGRGGRGERSSVHSQY